MYTCISYHMSWAARTHTIWFYGSSISDDTPDGLFTAVQDLLKAESLAQDPRNPEYQKLWAGTIVRATGLVSQDTLDHAHQVVRPDSCARICQLFVDGQLVDLVYPCQGCYMDWDSCPNPAGTGAFAVPHANIVY